MDIYPKEVVFHPPYEEVNTTTIKLTNTTNNTLIYKVKTTSPNLYCVRPNASSIEAGHSRDIQITRQSKSVSQGETSKDKFLILSAAVDPKQLKDHENVAEYWTVLEKERDSNKVEAQKLKVVYSGHSGSSGQGTQGSSAGSQGYNTANESGSAGTAAAGGAAGGAGIAGLAAGSGSHGQSATRGYESKGVDSAGTHVPGTPSTPGAAGSAGAGYGEKLQTQNLGGQNYDNFSSPSSRNFESSQKGHTGPDSKDYSGKDFSKESPSKDYSSKDYSSKDYSSKDYSSKDHTSTTKDSKLNAPSTNSGSKHSDAGSITSGTSARTGSGPDGVVTVDDIQGIPGVPPKSKLIDEGDAKTGPNLANSKLPEGPKAEHGLKKDDKSQGEEDTTSENKDIHPKDRHHYGEGLSGSAASGAGATSTTSKNAVSSSNDSKTSGSSYVSGASEYAGNAKDAAAEYAAAAKDNAGEYASTAAEGASNVASTAAGAAAGAAGVAGAALGGAASSVSSWFSGSKSEDSKDSPSKDMSFKDSNTSFGTTSSPQRGAYAGGFENIVNAGGFEAAPASTSGERSVAGGPKTETPNYAAGQKSANQTLNNGAPITGASATGASAYPTTNSSHSTTGNKGPSGYTASANTGDQNTTTTPGFITIDEHSRSIGGNNTSYVGEHQIGAPSSAYSPTSGNNSTTRGVSTTGAAALGAAGASTLGSQSGSYGKHVDASQYKDKVPESKDAVGSTIGSKDYTSSSARSPEYGTSYSSSGNHGSSEYNTSNRGDNKDYGSAKDNLMSGNYNEAARNIRSDNGSSSNRDYDAAAKDLKHGDIKSAAQDLKGDSKNGNNATSSSYGSSAVGTAGVGSGVGSDYSSSADNHKSDSTLNSTSRGLSGSSDNASGFEKTVSGPASNVCGAYSNRDPTSTTVSRDSKTDPAPNVAQANDVPLNVTVLLVIIAFLIGWKFF